MNPLWLLRASKWARHPPSRNRVILVLAVIAICLMLFAAERLWGWPAWLTLEGRPRGRIVR